MDTQKRKLVQSTCLICENEFSIRKDFLLKGRGKYCSIKCRGLARRNRTSLDCKFCGNKIEKQVSNLKNSKSGLYFCNRKCKDAAQKIGGVREIMPSHYGEDRGKQLYKELIEKSENAKCVGCDNDSKYLLCVHHIDGNRRNNKIENLEIVCFNCHAKRHLKIKNDVWIYHPKYLTDRNLLSGL